MTLKNLRPMVLLAAALLAAVSAPAAADATDRAGGLWSRSGADPDAADSAAPAPDSSSSPGKETQSAEEHPSEGPLFEQDESSETTGLLGHSVAAVLIILVLGAAAVFVVKRLLPRLGISQGRRISVLETVYLGPRKSLHMVQVGDRTLLVSGTRERLALLADVTDAVPPEESAPLPGGKGPASRFRIPEMDGENG